MWIHYIASLKYSIQCNTRSGSPPRREGEEEISRCMGAGGIKPGRGNGEKRVKGGKKTQKLVAAAPRTQVSRAKDAMGVRDFLRTCILSKAKVGAGAIKDLAHGQARLHEASIFVAAASPEDTAWERAGLTMSVLPALRRRLQKHGIDLTWQDWHHLGSLSSPNTALQWFEPLTPGQPARKGR